jgi:hypothetical protein
LAEDSAVWVMLGSSAEPGPCPPYLEGACWGIADPVFAQFLRADALGVATWEFSLPAETPPGSERAVQAAVGDLEGVRLSNTETMVVPPAGPVPGDCTISGELASTLELVGAATPIAMAVGWDGTHYYATNGGGGGRPLYRFNEDGSLHDTTVTPYDLRSAFSKMPGEGPTYISRYSSTEIRVQGDGVTYEDVEVSLTGHPSYNSQSRISFDWLNQYFLTLRSGQVDQWDETGAYVGAVTLPGFSGYDATVGFADSACYVTFDGGTVSSWNLDGSLAGTVTLLDSGGEFYSLSYANGYVWRYQTDRWSGYPLGI